MRNLIALSLLLVGSLHSLAQATRVAILDFDNISGIAKYDGLGKAMSSMLISDIKANISLKRLQLVERAQIQKVLKEQNFQASGSVNKSTAVQAGKLLGVNYLLVGDIYILNDQLIINARLTNTETGDIVFAKKQEGKITAWLALKSNIAQDISSSFFLESELKNSIGKDVHVEGETQITEESILEFADVLNKVDSFEFNQALSKLQLCENIPDEYLYSCENIIRSQVYQYRFEYISKKVKNGEIGCSDLLEIPSHFGIENYGSIEYHRFFIDYKLDSVGAILFLLKENNHRKDSGLDTFQFISDWQDHTYYQILEYKKMLDIILDSENLPTNCVGDFKECAIGFWLTFFNDYLETISSNSHKERRDELHEIYKIYFKKLITLNPNSNQLSFVSYREFKKRYDFYVNFVSQYSEN
jgi:TolB-like protein